jgi:hypothetical protein
MGLLNTPISEPCREILQYQPLSLPASWTKQIDRCLAALVVKLADEFQVHGAALYAKHVEQSQQGFVAGFLRLIIFTAHEISGGVHDGTLAGRLDKGRPSKKKRCPDSEPNSVQKNLGFITARAEDV